MSERQKQAIQDENKDKARKRTATRFQGFKMLYIAEKRKRESEEQEKAKTFFHLKKIKIQITTHKNKTALKNSFKSAFFQGWGMF